MRQHSNISARAIGILLVVILPASLLAGGLAAADATVGKPSGTATHATLENPRKQDPETPSADSRQPDAAGSALTATPPAPSSPLTTSSPLPSSSPLAAPDAPDTTGSRPQAQSSQTWTVSFDPAGGSSIGGQTIPDGGQASRPSPDPSRDGYLFDGWFQGDVAYDFNQPVTRSIALTARWTKGDDNWSISPSQGPITGGAKVTLTPPAQRGIKFSQLSMGGMHSAALASDGSLYTWGDNGGGELGDGTNTNRNTPVQVKKPQGAPEGFIWKQASVGWSHSAAFGSDGNLYTWGDNGHGQLGDGTTTNRNRPIPVGKPQGAPEGFTWKRFILGDLNTAAFGSDGSLYTWGNNQYGQLGDGTTTDRSRPVLVGKPQGAPDGFTWKQVSIGWQHSAAIGSDGQLYTWGQNYRAQLGDGTTTDRHTPTLVGKPQGAPDGFTWKQISLGDWHTEALGSDGSFYIWGSNEHSQLGDGTTTNRSRPIPVGKPQGAPAGFTWKYAILGCNHSAAIGSNGQLYTWGVNGNGQLGDGTTTDRNRPVMVVFPGATTPTDVLFGQAKAMGGITANPDGTWQATTPAHDPGAVDVRVVWNRNGPQPDAHLQYTYIAPKYQVGFTSKDSSCPAPTGMPPSQAVTQDGQAERPQPDPKADGCLFDGWFQDNVAYDFTQPVTHDITLTARWTRTDTQHWTISPAQGPETGGTKVTLTPPKPRGIRFSQISAGRGNIAAVASDGNLYAWGSNQYGQLGDGTATDRHEPVRALKPEGAPAGFTWVQASAGYMFTLGLGSDGNIYSWGDNENATLGRSIGGKTINGIPADPRPGKVDKPQDAPAGFTWKHVEAGSLHALALGSDGQLYSWGLNEHGYVGNGTTTRQYTPVRVSLPEHAPSGFTWKRMSGWGWHSLALGSDNQLYGWGYSRACELGTGQITPDRLTPVPVAKPEGVSSWGQFQMGDYSSLAIGSDGNAYGWGSSFSGSVGNGDANVMVCTLAQARPSYAGQSWKQVSVHNSTSLGIDSAGRLYAWGNNDYGQIGDGTTIERHTPVQVAAPADGPSGLTWVQVSAGWDNLSYGLASDGNLYSWGSNINGQLGREPAEAWPASRPGPVGFPGKPQATSICFDQTRQQGACLAAGKNLTPNADGTWNATTPAYTPGPVPAAIDWTQDGIPQETDTSNTYRYLSIASLPLTGGNGMLLLLATGLLAAGAATAAKNRRQQTQTHTSHE
ncbi:InlB B-repeat-containing protein [Bifidobacterium sp. B4081]|uniref:RCC1 domain-containing protein n=4 Tax=Bifidobacterium TaxID=1678 RepID=UPI00226AD131|nr:MULTISPECIES: InlB B-repeat-containing protein [unclassified Bifidobacterium]MCX8644921.1 InlB B-repeat-containing protein [Bifidobacterium sp. B4077]MCX8646735.1 InlB B-repeat-containing protein [Bifidobacterium sp. B4081]